MHGIQSSGMFRFSVTPISCLGLFVRLSNRFQS